MGRVPLTTSIPRETATAMETEAEPSAEDAESVSFVDPFAELSNALEAEDEAEDGAEVDAVLHQIESLICEEQTEGALKAAMELFSEAMSAEGAGPGSMSKCAQCEEGIDAKAERVRVDGQTLHAACFVCSECGCALAHTKYMQVLDAKRDGCDC